MSQFAKFPASGGGGSSVFWKDASASFGTLPAGSSTGELRQTLDTQDIYRWDGAAWQLWLDYSDGALLDSHILDTATHGATGAVVGTTNTQTLTNKTIVAASNTITTAASGNLTSTELNAALSELQGDIDSRALTTDLTTHESDTSTHGVGEVVGTSETQTLTNKTISGASNTLSNIASTSTTFATETSLAIGTSSSDTTVDIANNTGANVVNIGGANTTINLTGTVNNQDVTNLNVTDKLITINDGGGAGSGGGAGLEIEENASITGYVKTSADRNSLEIKAPNTAGIASLTPGASNDTVALLAATQALTNKTVVAASNTITTAASGNLTSTELNAALAELQGDIDTRLVDELTTKGDLLVRGASAEQRLAVGTDGQVLKADSSATNGVSWADISAGGINYIDNADFESTVTTGITDGTNITSAAETTNEIRGSQSLQINIGTGVSTGAFLVMSMRNIDPADKGKALTLSFEYATDTDYTSDDVEVRIYDNTNAAYITVNATEDFDGKLKATGGVTDSRKFIGQWYAADDSDDYEVRFYVNSAPSTASQIIVDNVRVGPESFYNMPIVSDWMDYTPTVGATNMSATGKYRRVGDVMEVKLAAVATAAPVGSMTFTLPSGHTIDSSKFPLGYTGGHKVGMVYLEDNAITGYDAVVSIASSTSVSFVISNVASTYPSSAGVTSAVPFSWNTNDYIRASFSVPILEWANSSTTMSTTQANLQTVKARYTNSAAYSIPSSGVATVIDFPTKTKDTHNTVSGSGTGWIYTAPTKQTVTVKAFILYEQTTFTAGGNCELRLNKNGTHYSSMGVTAIRVTGNQYVPVNGIDTIDLEAGDTISVGTLHSEASARTLIASSLYNAITIEQEPDFTTIGVYSPYEVKSASAGPATPSGSGIVSQSGHYVPLTPGTWEVSAQVYFGASGGSPAYTDCEAYWSTASGSVVAPTFDDIDPSGIGARLTSGSLEYFSQVLPASTITVTENTNLYVIAALTAGTYANSRVYSRPRAKRLK